MACCSPRTDRQARAVTAGISDEHESVFHLRAETDAHPGESRDVGLDRCVRRHVEEDVAGFGDNVEGEDVGLRVGLGVWGCEVSAVGLWVWAIQG